ncbi:hypothetical protein JJD26997_1145 [Campylobacter jejuni subsp. doylei 269.97]|uniref:Transposase n=2 Tax=Campylobacter jejuni subsp. doylei TaxID=32021 RepID=A7H3Z7_CAMJD|nr:hypothetical protein JJD26997_1145 [Campylobacter jejuni subsp. doylei 269.97]AVL47458.1 hypothetical protein CEP74_06685 [Campylobacter jejuni subsp. doylei]
MESKLRRKSKRFIEVLILNAFTLSKSYPQVKLKGLKPFFTWAKLLRYARFKISLKMNLR